MCTSVPATLEKRKEKVAARVARRFSDHSARFEFQFGQFLSFYLIANFAYYIDFRTDFDSNSDSYFINLSDRHFFLDRFRGFCPVIWTSGNPEQLLIFQLTTKQVSLQCYLGGWNIGEQRDK